MSSFPYHNKLDTHLQKKLKNRLLKNNTNRIPVIIRFRKHPSHFQIQKFNQSISNHHFQLKTSHKMIRSISAKVSSPYLQKLCEVNNIEKIYLDQKRHTMLNIATPAIGAKRMQRSGINGRGITVALLDTGIYPHPDLTKPVNRIIGFKDFINNRRKPYDDNGHGTHVAGDVAGNGYRSKGKYKGPASKARLVGVKVLDRQGSGSTSDIIKGLEWCIRNKKKYGIRVVSMSLGGEPTRCVDDPLCLMVNKVWRRGIVVVLAAGNEGPSSRTISSPANSPYAISVGAADDHHSIKQSDDSIARFSSRGPTVEGYTKPDIVAPGVSIISLRSPRSLLDQNNPRSRVGKYYFTLSGTSMATPIVAGTAAQILSKYQTWSPKKVKTALKNHAYSLQRSRNAQGKGEINVRFL